MFTIFNTESLWIGSNADRFYEIRNLLDDAGVRYKYKVKNRLGGMSGRGGSMRGHYGSYGNPTEQMYQYEILVHRKDWDRAKYCIR